MKVAESAITQPINAMPAAPQSPELTALLASHPFPSFFIVGPPRTGTSWLHDALTGRAVLPANSKETRFFDRHFHRGFAWYLTRFSASQGAIPVGEVAPTYFASYDARNRIAKYIPQAKIVCIFRNPVERVLSLYRLKRAYAMFRWNFEQAINGDPELMQSAQYVTNLIAWQRSFGAEHVLATIFDDLQQDPQGYLNSIADFVGIPRFAIPGSLTLPVNDSASMTHPRNYYFTRGATFLAEWCKARSLDRVVSTLKKTRLRNLVLSGGPSFTEAPRELVCKLAELLRPEVEALEAVLNRDLSAWKLPIAH